MEFKNMAALVAAATTAYCAGAGDAPASSSLDPVALIHREIAAGKTVVSVPCARCQMTPHECYAVQITPEYEWMEGGCSKDVVVRGNTLVNNGGGVWLAGNNGARKPLPADSHRNVAITGNTISGSLNGIRVVGCTGLDVRGNTVVPSNHPEAVGIALKNVADVQE